MRWIKNIAHSLMGHEWSKWETFRVSRDADFGTPLVYQSRECYVCGKIKTRCETG